MEIQTKTAEILCHWDFSHGNALSWGGINGLIELPRWCRRWNFHQWRRWKRWRNSSYSWCWCWEPVIRLPEICSHDFSNDTAKRRRIWWWRWGAATSSIVRFVATATGAAVMMFAVMTTTTPQGTGVLLIRLTVMTRRTWVWLLGRRYNWIHRFGTFLRDVFRLAENECGLLHGKRRLSCVHGDASCLRRDAQLNKMWMMWNNACSRRCCCCHPISVWTHEDHWSDNLDAERLIQ